MTTPSRLRRLREGQYRMTLAAFDTGEGECRQALRACVIAFRCKLGELTDTKPSPPPLASTLPKGE
jgi:hypothetical protein